MGPHVVADVPNHLHAGEGTEAMVVDLCTAGIYAPLARKIVQAWQSAWNSSAWTLRPEDADAPGIFETAGGQQWVDSWKQALSVCLNTPASERELSVLFAPVPLAEPGLYAAAMLRQLDYLRDTWLKQ